MSSNLVFDGDASKYEAGDPLLKLSQEKRAYVEEVAYYAQQEYSRRVAAGEDWVLPEVAVSQAILETGWGQSRGANDFGIKAWSGSDRSKTTLSTKEESSDGSLYSTNAAFEQTSSIEDSVNLYYDFITSNSRYSNALNLTDPYQSVKEIAAAGYATSHSYDDNLISIIKNYNLSRYSTTAVTSFDYSEAGYNEGIAAYEEAIKIIIDLETSLADSENTIKTACLTKPQISYESIIEFEKIKEVVTTIKELLERIKGIADREKYIAEQYNLDSSSLTQFKAATLSLGTINYSFNNDEDFIKMVDEYKSSDSSTVFSTWFQSYISQNGVASNIVDMNKYLENIKSTYAITSENHVVSTATEILQTEQTATTSSVANSQTQSTLQTSSNSTSGTQFSASTITTSPTTSTSKNTTVSTNVVTQTTTPTTETKQNTTTVTTPVISNSQNSSETSSAQNNSQNTSDTSSTIFPDSKVEQDSTSTPTTSTTNELLPEETTSTLANKQSTLLQPGFISNSNNTSTKIKEISSLITPATTQPDNSQIIDSEIPTESTITEIIPGTSNSNTTVSTQTDNDTNTTALAIGLGIGATALGVGAGAYYINKKRQENSDIAEEYEQTEDEDQQEYYKDDYYEEEKDFFPQDDLDDEDDYLE